MAIGHGEAVSVYVPDVPVGERTPKASVAPTTEYHLVGTDQVVVIAGRATPCP